MRAGEPAVVDGSGGRRPGPVGTLVRRDWAEGAEDNEVDGVGDEDGVSATSGGLSGLPATGVPWVEPRPPKRIRSPVPS